MKLTDKMVRKSVSKKFREFRKTTGFSQTRLARAIGTSQSVISKIENLEVTPTIVTATRAAKVMKTTVEALCI